MSTLGYSMGRGRGAQRRGPSTRVEAPPEFLQDEHRASASDQW
jgi:hypothetical protein